MHFTISKLRCSFFVRRILSQLHENEEKHRAHRELAARVILGTSNQSTLTFLDLRQKLLPRFNTIRFVGTHKPDKYFHSPIWP